MIEHKSKQTKYHYLIFSLILFLAFIGFILLKNRFSFLTETTPINFIKNFFKISEKQQLNDKYTEIDRLNFLILGIRGEGVENGGLLSDSIIIFSTNKKTEKTALISIPRDLYLKIPEYNLETKINSAYAFGKTISQSKSMEIAKQAVEIITGVHINNVVIIDFDGFKKIIDALGGITIHLDQPFAGIQIQNEEQESDENYTPTENDLPFYLPAGENHLDGRAALYYARSRYTSNDFERSKRQQQILIAIINKMRSTSLINNPFRLKEIMNIFNNNLKTDMDFSDINNLLSLYGNLDFKNIKKQNFDTSSGILYSSYSDSGAYILLPTGGNFDQIKKICREILN